MYRGTCGLLSPSGPTRGCTEVPAPRWKRGAGEPPPPPFRPLVLVSSVPVRIVGYSVCEEHVAQTTRSPSSNPWFRPRVTSWQALDVMLTLRSLAHYSQPQGRTSFRVGTEATHCESEASAASIRLASHRERRVNSSADSPQLVRPVGRLRAQPNSRDGGEGQSDLCE